MSADVLVVGAGPVGLALALQAADHGATVRVVEQRTDAFRPSRALIVHARTLELLRPLGVTGALLERADTAPAARLHLGRRTVAVAAAGLDLPDTAFPHLTLVRQMDVETVLEAALADRGVRVERGVAVGAVHDHGDAAVAELGGPSGRGRIRAAAVAGCDGVDSTVRTAAGLAWRGGSYDREVVLADVDLDGDLEPGVAHVAAGRRGLVFVFALGEGAPWRLLATRPCSPAGRAGLPVPAGELQRLLADAGLGARVTAVAWSSGIRLQHRTAAPFRRGRLFVAGDAAHASSPAGGQGMNTGLHDATNLGWKLALAPEATAAASLLDSYDAERRPAAEQVLALTHALFWVESSTGRLAALLRGRNAPLGAPLAPFLLRRRRLVADGARLLARLDAGYRRSPLSATGNPPRGGRPAPGDRLPDATVPSGDGEVRLHALTARPGVHLLLDRDAPAPAWGHPLVHVHRLASTPGTGALAVRPDGYVGCAVADADDPALTGWLRRIGVPPSAAAGARREAGSAAGRR